MEGDRIEEQDGAEAFRMAADAADEHKKLMELRLVMANFVSRAAAAIGENTSEEERVKLAMTMARDLAAYGRLYGDTGRN